VKNGYIGRACEKDEQSQEKEQPAKPIAKLTEHDDLDTDAG
jgi:hypothetical protein